MRYRMILTNKGVTTIPAEVRRRLGLKPGMHVFFIRDDNTGDYTIKGSRVAATRLSAEKVRSWARAEGHHVGERGPLPRQLIRRYEQAKGA